MTCSRAALSRRSLCAWLSVRSVSATLRTFMVWHFLPVQAQPTAGSVTLAAVLEICLTWDRGRAEPWRAHSGGVVPSVNERHVVGSQLAVRRAGTRGR